MAEVQIQSISHRHEAIVDWLLANPGKRNMQALAEHIGFSRSWISIVMRSDVFREYYERRRLEFNGEMSRRIVEKQQIVTMKALDRLEAFLDDDESDLDARAASDIANKTAQMLGYGTKPPTTKVKDEVIQEVTRPVSAGALATAREIIRRTITTERSVDVPETP